MSTGADEELPVILEYIDEGPHLETPQSDVMSIMPVLANHIMLPSITRGQQPTGQDDGLSITPVPAGHAVPSTTARFQRETEPSGGMTITPVSAHDALHPALAAWYREPWPAKPGSRRRRTRLLTLRREAARPARRPADATARDFQRGIGLQQWLSTLLAQRHTLELDITVLSFILHALWKKSDRRHLMLRDVEFRKRTFNAFLMDVLKAYQSWEKVDDSPPDGASNNNTKQDAEPSDQHSPVDGDPLEPSDELAEVLLADLSDGDRPEDDAPAPESGTERNAPARRTRRRRKKRSKEPVLRRAAANGIMLGAAQAPSGDLCRRVPNLVRTAGRKPTSDLPCCQLADREEDDSAVPRSAFLFIRCVRCPDVVFKDYRSIREHHETHCHFLSCIMCDNIVSSSRLALAHLRLTHMEPAPDDWFRLVRCHQCRRSGFRSTEEVITHMAGHRAERSRNPATFPPFLTCYKHIRCNQCGMRKVNHRTELEDHYKRDPPPPCEHDDARPPSVTCPLCDRVWVGAAALAAHLKLSRGMCKGVPARRPERCVCPVCHRRLPPGEVVADHLLTHRTPGLRCVECGFVAASHQQMKAHWAFTWRCDCAACDTHVGRGTRLLQHVVEDHDGGKLLTETARARPRRNPDDQGICPMCGKFQTKVKDHIDRCHTTRYCQCCDKMVKTSTWRKHRLRQKNPDRTRCKVCQKVLCSLYAMKGHMRLHTGERPYECEFCEAAYPQRCQLKAHMKTAHDLALPLDGPSDAATAMSP